MSVHSTLSLTADFASLLLAGLLVGAMFAVCLILNPAGMDASAYVTQQQRAIRTLNVKLPILGGLATLLAFVTATFRRGSSVELSFAVIAGTLFLAVGLITRFLNQP